MLLVYPNVGNLKKEGKVKRLFIVFVLVFSFVMLLTACSGKADPARDFE